LFGEFPAFRQTDRVVTARSRRSPTVFPANTGEHKLGVVLDGGKLLGRRRDLHLGDLRAFTLPNEDPLNVNHVVSADLSFQKEPGKSVLLAAFLRLEHDCATAEYAGRKAFFKLFESPRPLRHRNLHHHHTCLVGHILESGEVLRFRESFLGNKAQMRSFDWNANRVLPGTRRDHRG
jgi:hypothetical protein